MMICIQSPFTDQAAGLAAEEYLLSLVQEECFMLWRSHRAVVVGLNQNAWSQVNASFLREKAIPMIRRISGGGAVYHDMGNVNFTFIRPFQKNPRVAYEPFLRPVRRFLTGLGVPVFLDGKSDLAANGLKISGNAQHIQRGKVLHHGTLLFDSNLSTLSEALRVSEGKYIGKSVDSIRKKVANIRPLLQSDMTVERFMNRFMAEIMRETDGRRVTFSRLDRDAIQDIARNRYARWDWNIGRGPAYRFENHTDRFAIGFDVRSGILHNVSVSGGDLSSQTARGLETALTGCIHQFEDMAEAMRHIGSVFVDELIRAMF